MHFADAFARRRRNATRLISGYDKQPRFFGLARRSVAALCVFGGARDRFAAGLLACSFETTLVLGGASRFLAGLLPRSLTSDLEAALLLGLSSGSSLFSRLLSTFLARGFTSGFEVPLILGRTRGRLLAGLFPRGLACRLDTTLPFGSAGGGFATRFFSRRLAGRLANGIKAARLFGIARLRITFCVIARYGVTARLAPPRLPAVRPLATGIVPTGLVASTFTLARIAAFPIAAWTIVSTLAPWPTVAIAPVRSGLEFILGFALRGTFITAFAAILAVRTAFVSGRRTIT